MGLPALLLITLSLVAAGWSLAADQEAQRPAEDGLAASSIDPVAEAVGTWRYTGWEAFEPTIGASPDGTLFFSSMDGGIPNGSLVHRSDDLGASWQDVTPKLAGNVSAPPQTNDPYLHVDPDTGRLFLSDLQALVCSTLSWSDDAGGTWTTNPIGCGHPVGVHDHQTVWTSRPVALEPTGDYPNLVHYCVNRVADTACAVSLDGGLTFSPLRPLVYQSSQATQPGGPVAVQSCGGLTSHGEAGPDGTIYLPRSYCDTPTVAISQDDGLTWRAATIDPDGEQIDHDLGFAVDEAGNAYALWIDASDHLPRLSVSTDGGLTWSPGQAVAPASVNMTRFPELAAGAQGRIALAYYGTSSHPEALEAATWNAYLTVLTGADTEDPSVQTVATNPPTDPMARGPCDGRCDGVGDFIDLIIDPDGRPWAALVDVCNGPCAEPTGTENAGIRGMAGTLAEGPALRGPSGPLEAIERPEIPTGPPDLAWVEVPEVPRLVPDDQPVSFEVTLANLGGQASGTFEVVAEADGQLVASRTVDDLAPGQRLELSLGPYQPDEAGTTAVEIVADAGQAVEEATESNNAASLELQVDCQEPGPDGFGYTCEVRELSPADVPGGTPVVLQADGTSNPVVLGFTFPFYGLSTERVWLSEDGVIGIEAPVTACCPAGTVSVVQPVGSPAPPNGFVAAHWQEMAPGDQPIRWERTTVDGQQALVVKATGLQPSLGDGPVTLQVELLESGEIRIHTVQAPAGPIAPVGIESPTGLQALVASEGGLDAAGTTIVLSPPAGGQAGMGPLEAP